MSVVSPNCRLQVTLFQQSLFGQAPKQTSPRNIGALRVGEAVCDQPLQSSTPHTMTSI